MLATVSNANEPWGIARLPHAWLNRICAALGEIDISSQALCAEPLAQLRQDVPLTFTRDVAGTAAPQTYSQWAH
jgi:hypothetical protein